MSRTTKKVMFIDSAVTFGGSLVVLGNIIKHLDKKCYQPVLVTELDSSLSSDFVGEDTSVFRIARIYNYRQWDKTIGIIRKIPYSIPRRMANYILSAVRSSANSIYSVRLAYRVLKERVDILHVNNGINNLAPVIVSLILRRSFIVHVHGMENPGIIQKLVIKHVPLFITLSKYMKEGLVRNGFPEDRIVVLPNPISYKNVNEEKVRMIKERYSLGRGVCVVGIVGRITEWKGHKEFVSAVVDVMAEIKNLKVLIVGDYTDLNHAYKKEISFLVEKSGYQDRFIFTGYVNDVESYYCVMDVCVHASVKPEPFGLVITEAMSYGIPVMASCIGAPNEIITSGVNGVLLDPSNHEEFVKKLRTILKDNRLRERIGANAKVHVLREYDVSQYLKTMTNIYEKIMLM